MDKMIIRRVRGKRQMAELEKEIENLLCCGWRIVSWSVIPKVFRTSVTVELTKLHCGACCDEADTETDPD